MDVNLYIVYDTVSMYMTGGILRARNDEVARRAFYEALAAKDSPIGQHPDDYELWLLGEINEATAVLVPNDTIQRVATGKDWLDANKGA